MLNFCGPMLLTHPCVRSCREWTRSAQVLLHSRRPWHWYTLVCQVNSKSLNEHGQIRTLAVSSGLFRMVDARLATAVTPVPPARSPAQMRKNGPAQRKLRHPGPVTECGSDLCMCAA